MKYKRVLLKLSGESLMGSQNYGIDPTMLEQYSADIRQAVDAGVEVAIVIGGGNIFRGLSGAAKGMDRVQGDYMGMLATLINSMALQAELEKQGLRTELLSGLAIEPICKEMSRRRAIEAMRDGRVVIIGGGSGNPFFTTDTASALRAVEIQADAILKGTRVDGVYTADPEKDPSATKYTSLSFQEALNKKTQNHGPHSLRTLRGKPPPHLCFRHEPQRQPAPRRLWRPNRNRSNIKSPLFNL